MAKMRVYELAKILGTDSSSLLSFMETIGLGGKSNFSALEDEQVEKIKKAWAEKKEKKEERAPEKEERKTAPEAGRKPEEKGKMGAPQAGEGRATQAGREQVKRKEPRERERREQRQEKIKIPMRARLEPPRPETKPAQPPGRQQPSRPVVEEKKSEKREEKKEAVAKVAAQPKGKETVHEGAKETTPAKAPAAQQRPARPAPRQERGRPSPAPAERRREQREEGRPARPERPRRLEIPKPEVVPEARKEPKKGLHIAAKDKELRKDKKFELEEELESKLRKPEEKKEKERKEAEAPKLPKEIVIGETITVQELAQKMHRSAAEVIKKLMSLGVMATINQEIDAETAEIVAAEYGIEVQVKKEDVEEQIAALFEQPDDPADLVPRPPVVTVMGHVDHGKTSLLDAIRQTNVTATEAGGITQHIGAYQVEKDGKKITFLDTPGHAAFTAMRARGAQVTDIAVLVVAADDGVMPQTVEAINHARAANVPIIVAINKIDKPDANPERVKQQLTEYGLIPEEWGGDTICVNVSAKTKQGIDELLEMILLVAEMAELKANPNRKAKGTIIEAKLDKGRGPVATVLVQNGTLEVGDPVFAGFAYGRVRAMMDFQGRRVKKATPSMPVEVLGLSDVPQAGDILYAVEDEKIARQFAEKRLAKKREEEMKATTRVTLDDLFKKIQEGQVKELNVVIKADVQGSVEALRTALEKLSNEEVRVNIIHGGVGAISETDIMLASASNAIVIGFNVRPDANARKAAEAEKVDVRLYRVIYDAIEDVKAAMSGLLEPEYREVFVGRAEVRQIFKVPKLGIAAGCYVLEGKITRNAQVRLIRDGVVIHEGRLASLKRFKDDVREVVQGYECGLMIENYNDINEGDIIEAFVMEEVKRKL